MTIKNVTIIGGGNGAFANAAVLALKGFSVRLLEVPELASETIAPIQEAGGIELLNGQVVGLPSDFAPLELITDNPEKALDGAEIVLYIVPAFAEQRFTELCMSSFRSDQLVVFLCGNFGGALEFANQLTARGDSQLPMIAETEGLVYTGFKQSSNSVKLGGYKAGLSCSAFPANQIEGVLKRLQPLFPDFQMASSVLETSLRNLNPVVHAPVSVLNAGRTDPHQPQWRYYWEGVTEPIGHVVEAVDLERIAVGQKLGIRLPSTKDVLLRWYGHQGAKGETLAEVMSTNPAFEVAWAPQTLEHRFLTEDIPFGLVPIEALGSSMGATTPVISAIITLADKLLNTDFRVEGRNLTRLGMEGLDIEQIRRLAEAA